ncbi:hypothetical protein DL769_005852 [Monosporascus sp. CRB-8-3]|nr:hypothetical protein DL769_005852 [Monosporascus sp. CRB-8-3]
MLTFWRPDSRRLVSGLRVFEPVWTIRRISRPVGFLEHLCHSIGLVGWWVGSIISSEIDKMIPLRVPVRLPEIRVVQRSHREFHPEFEGLAPLGVFAAIETACSHLAPPSGHQLFEDDARQLMEGTNSALAHDSFQDMRKVDRHNLAVAALGQTETTLAIRAETVEVNLLV